MAPLHMVLVHNSALDSTRGGTVVQKASASCCKGVHPYTNLRRHTSHYCIYVARDTSPGDSCPDSLANNMDYSSAEYMKRSTYKYHSAMASVARWWYKLAKPKRGALGPIEVWVAVLVSI